MKWKTINIFDGRFIISDTGEVYNTFTKHYITPYINNKGYKVIDLYCNGTRKKKLVHRLVAEAFIDNPSNFPVVMHLDDNPLNCNVNNLRWGTYYDNNMQAINEGHLKIPRPDNRKEYYLYNKDNGYGYYFKGIKDVMRFTGINNDSSIRNYLYRKSPITTGSFKGYFINKLGKRSTIIP